MTRTVHLGFTCPEGEPYRIQLHHTVITGMTDISGKTTTAEAEIRRHCEQGGTALVFLTKRGEKTFQGAREIKPYYKERFDWEYLRTLLEATMKERLKFETPWIMRISKEAAKSKEGASLNKVSELLKEALELHEKGKKKLKNIDYNLFTMLDGYLDKILPHLNKAREKGQVTDVFELQPGLNVMDLKPWYGGRKQAFQMVVIRSCMERILEKVNNCALVLPEAWKMLPQGRNTPVKLYFEQFIREGATNGNFLIIDAQDLRGVDKLLLTNVSIWIMGKMMQANEVERILKQTLNVGVKAEDIQRLELGHFIVANGISNTVQKIYVWPWDTPEDLAKAVAKGTQKPELVRDSIARSKIEVDEESKLPEELEERISELEEEAERGLRDTIHFQEMLNALQRQIDEVGRILSGKTQVEDHRRLEDRIGEVQDKANRCIDGVAEIRARLEAREVATATSVELTDVTTEIGVKEAKIQVHVTTEDNEGKILWLASRIVNEETGERFLDDWKTQTEIENALLKEGWRMPRITLYRTLEKLSSKGYIAVLKGGKGRPNTARVSRHVVFT